MTDQSDQPEHRQLNFPIEHPVSFEREDFLVSASNIEAVRLIDAWPGWPTNTVALVGPADTGKTHLATVWSEMANAHVLETRSLATKDIAAITDGAAVLLEDADREMIDENALFHLLNLVREHNAYLLMTSRALPAAWNIDLPDLISRLRAIHVAEIRKPDEELLSAVLAKLFADRQLLVDKGVLDYAVLRMPRSMKAASELVRRLDETAMAKSRAITKSIARDCLDQMDAPE